jgi:hypothetical protein
MAPTPSPDPFLHGDRAIYDVYIANRASAALAVAVRLGVFVKLAAHPTTLRELAGDLGLAERPTDALLTSLVSLGLLERHGDGVDGPLSWNAAGSPEPRYAPTALARDHLLPGSRFYLGGLIDIENEHFVTPQNLIEAIRRNRPEAYGGADPWEAIMADPKGAADFTRAMHSISLRPAFGLAATFDFGGVGSLLDAGGGSGILSIAAVLKNPGLRATILELPVVADVARETVRDYQLEDRIRVVEGNMMTEPLPGGHDAVLFSQILHDWPPETARILLARAHEALNPGGQVLVHEKLLSDRRDGPMATALVSIDMVYWTEGQQYSAAELAALLREAGFVEPRTRATVGYWSITWAKKAERG